jgi:ribonuclease HII
MATGYRKIPQNSAGLNLTVLSMNNNLKPTFDEENLLRASGLRIIAGIDEVGRGALAGPVAAGAVILPAKIRFAWLKDVRDSKMLSPKTREGLSEKIKGAAISYSIGLVPPHLIDSIGILNATRLAMKRAIEGLKYRPDSLLIDYLSLPGVSLPQKGVINGDTLCMSIACASIIAKVERDAIMVSFDHLYPGYQFAENKGYGTGEHVDQLEKRGFSPIHRLTFHPKRMLPGFALTNHDEAYRNG